MDLLGLHFHTLYNPRPHKKDRDIVIIGPEGYSSSCNAIEVYSDDGADVYTKFNNYLEFYKKLQNQVSKSLDYDYIISEPFENIEKILFEKTSLLKENPNLEYIKLNNRGSAYIFSLSAAQKIVSHIEESGVNDNIQNTIKSIKLKHAYEDCLPNNKYSAHFPTSKSKKK